MHTSSWKYIINAVIHPTCFGHSCGHPQGGALRRLNTLRCYKSLWTNAHTKYFIVKITWFQIVLQFKTQTKTQFTPSVQSTQSTAHSHSIVKCNPSTAESSRLQKQRSTQSTAHSHSNVKCNPSTVDNSRLQKQRSTQSTAHSHSTVKCNPSVPVRKSSPWRWPSRVETCRSVLRLMIKLSLCICLLLVFFECLNVKSLLHVVTVLYYMVKVDRINEPKFNLRRRKGWCTNVCCRCLRPCL
jgi:hypothetical protein